MSVSGYVRGRGLSVDGLIHLPELGDFQMRKIYAPPDPCSLKGRRLSAAETMETVSGLYFFLSMHIRMCLCRMMLFVWQRRIFERYRKQIHPIRFALF